MVARREGSVLFRLVVCYKAGGFFIIWCSSGAMLLCFDNGGNETVLGENEILLLIY